MIWQEKKEALTFIKKQWQEDQSRRVAWKRLQPLYDRFQESIIQTEEISAYISKKMQGLGGSMTSLTLLRPQALQTPPNAPQWEKRTLNLQAQAPSDTIFYQLMYDLLTNAPGIFSLDVCHLQRQKTSDEKVIISGSLRCHWIYRPLHKNNRKKGA